MAVPAVKPAAGDRPTTGTLAMTLPLSEKLTVPRVTGWPLRVRVAKRVTGVVLVAVVALEVSVIAVPYWPVRLAKDDELEVDL